MKPARRFLWRVLDALLLGVAGLYLVAGIGLVPFHGDESATISMSRDWFRLTAGDFASMYLRLPPPDAGYAAEQFLRLQNGVISKYLIGLFWNVRGGTAEALTPEWFWALDWDYNVQHGHYPPPDLLLTARLSAAIPAALAAVVVFLIGLRLGGRKVAYPAVLIYALMPLVALNGRRAMYEGALLLAASLLVYMGILAVSSLRRGQHIWLCWGLVGLASALAVATKHTALLMVVPVIGVMLWESRRTWRQTAAGLVLCGVVMGVVLFALHPAWWPDLVAAFGQIVAARADTIRQQAVHFRLYDDFPARIAAPFHAIFGSPQYYEVPDGWPIWLADQIAAYETSGLSGFPLGGLVGAVLVALGAYSAWKKRAASGSPEAVLPLLITAGFILAALYLTNPLPWWRYYMPLSVPFALLAGAGIAFPVDWVLRTVRSRFVPHKES